MSPSNDTKQRILDSARSLLHTKNYSDVGVAEICTEAGVKKGSFYHFFPSKRDLTLEVLDQTFLRFKEGLLDRAFARDVSPMARLQRFIDMSYQLQLHLYQEMGFVPGCPFGNISAEQATQDNQLREKVDALFKRIESEIRDTVLAAVEVGEMGEIDVDTTTAAMLAYLEGVILMAKTRNDPEVLKTLLPAMLEIRIT